MTRRVKRLRDFEFVLNIRNSHFVRPPRNAQRDWLLNRAVNEFANDLLQLNQIAKDFVPGASGDEPVHWKDGPLSDEDIMEDWQIPVMRAMAEIATRSKGSVLEIGFGRGVSADFIQEFEPAAHHIIESSDEIVPRFHTWQSGYPGRDIRLIHSRWQDAVDQLDTYDAVFFHTYPMSEEEYVDQIAKSVTFAEHFFPAAARLLREGGVFTYLTNEIDSLSRAHQRLIFKYFRSFSLQILPLDIPADTRDDWWAGSMAVVEAVR